jgi:hypothetical protein
MQFRRFNDLGVKAFVEYLNALRDNPAAPIPTDLLENARLTQVLDPSIETKSGAFATRMDFVRWIDGAAKAAGAEIPRRDPGFWAWLTLALFDQVCPVDAAGKRVVKEDARYLPMLDTPRRYYRHCLVGPYSVFAIYEAAPDKAAALLCGSLNKLADEAYRLFVENQLVIYPAAMSVLSDFYFDAARNRLKRGSQTKKPGSIRRLARVLTQYARTFDLDIVPGDSLSKMLPYEFNRWRSSDRPLFNHSP